MAECQYCNEAGSNRNIYPALAIAAIAGVAVTYFFVARKTKSAESPLSVDKVVNLCNAAADKLDRFVAQTLAS